MSPIFLNDIDHFLQNELMIERYPDAERGGIYYPSKRPIHRIGMALEPFPKLADWIVENQLDALWLHRPWQLDLASMPADIGVLAHHLPFDESLTVGYNPRLAELLGATSKLVPLGYKQETNQTATLVTNRPQGMLIDVSQQEFDHLLSIIRNLFGGYDRAEAGHNAGGWQPTSSRIAVVGAMTNVLVREAAGLGAHLYLTGAYRKPGQQAVDETGIAVIAIGHRRSEEWGMQLLADLLHERWAVECVVREPLVLH